MKLNQVAIQLFTLRDHCKTLEDFTKTIQKVSKIGYRAAQVSGIGPIPEEDVIKVLKGEGIVCCATHESPDLILKEPQRVIDRLGKLECTYTAYPYPGGVDLKSEASVTEMIQGLNRSGEILHRAGKVLCYHNHGKEFAKLGNSTILEKIYTETDSQFLQGELDTYWVQTGGGDNVAWCRKLRNRTPLLHIKDYGIDPQTEQPTYMEIGSGNLNFKEIIEAADQSACLWYIVEQDTCPGDPFDSVQKSFDYIKKYLVS
ncbi:MAG: sugar phosphate isomerase/epimerase [Verrucomicrobiota bacterium]